MTAARPSPLSRGPLTIGRGGERGGGGKEKGEGRRRAEACRGRNNRTGASLLPHFLPSAFLSLSPPPPPSSLLPHSSLLPPPSSLLPPPSSLLPPPSSLFQQGATASAPRPHISQHHWCLANGNGSSSLSKAYRRSAATVLLLHHQLLRTLFNAKEIELKHRDMCKGVTPLLYLNGSHHSLSIIHISN